MSKFETGRRRAEEDAYLEGVRKDKTAEKPGEKEVKGLMPETPTEEIEEIGDTIEETSEAIEETVYGEPASFAQQMVVEGRSAMLSGLTCALTEMAPGALLTKEVIAACDESRRRRIEQLRGEITDLDEGGEV